MKKTDVVIAPGIELMDGKLLTCPGCGLRALGHEPPHSLEDVTAWYMGAYAGLTTMGAKGFTEARAIEKARAYVAEPWCKQG